MGDNPIDTYKEPVSEKVPFSYSHISVHFCTRVKAKCEGRKEFIDRRYVKNNDRIKAQREEVPKKRTC